MGKRSDFERRERDFYPTPAAAITPLIRHLPSNSAFIEPCAGDGAMVRHLKKMGHKCVGAFDIEPRGEGIEKLDSITDKIDINGADFIITNPPWRRDLLHPMITKFSTMLPTWLLFDADWMHTLQAAPFQPLLRKIVSVGRVKWIPGSKMVGKDNCCWYLFDSRGSGHTRFIGRFV